MTPYPLKDWLLSAVVELDLISPGVAGHVARASPERRQVIAALMSVTPNASFTKELGVAVQTARHDDLINVAFGTNPPGFRTALAKVGAHPQPRRFYQYLFRILTAQSRYDSAVVIRLLPRVTYPRLQVLRALPSDLRSPQLIESLTDEQQARDLAAIVALFTERGADRDQMCRSLAKVESPSAIRELPLRCHPARLL